MATWELQLVSRIVRSGDLNSVVQWGITTDDFLTNEGRALWTALVGYHQMPQTSGAVLGPNAVQRIFPNFVLCDDPSMTVESLCLEVRQQRLVIEYRMLLEQQLQMVEMDPLGAINRTQMAMVDLQNVGLSQHTDVHFHDSFDRSIQRMELIEQGVDLSCGRFPWDPLQAVTGGLQPDDYIVIFGRPKSMKSWVIAYLLSHFYEQQKRILIYTKEMTADNIFARSGACLASIRYQEFRMGKLSYDEKQSLYTVQRMLKMARHQQSVVCLSGKDATEGGDTVPWLRSKIETYKPDVVFVDGMYLMTDAKGAKKDNFRVQNISRALRDTVLQTKVPVIATIQANRNAAKNEEANTDEVAFSDSLSQDCTMLMRAINEKNSPTIALVMSGVSREFHLNGFRIYGVPALNFEYYGPLSDKEIEKAKDADEAADTSKPTPAAKVPTKPATEGSNFIDMKKSVDKHF
jgi:hypothetical protein